MTARLRHGVLLLAAGGSLRLGQSKQLLRMDGETLVHRAARLALDTAPDDALVVLGAGADALAAAVADLPIRPVACAGWAQGMGASLATGLAALSPDCDVALVLLCDQPALDAAHLAQLLAAARAAPGRAAASAYGGVLGVPAVLPRAWFAALSTRREDRGARDLLRERAGEVMAVTAPALSRDIDRPEDLHAAGVDPALGADTLGE